MTAMDDFTGRVAVITGAASGIGLGLARTAAREGMRVVMADIEETVLEEAAASVAELGAETLDGADRRHRPRRRRGARRCRVRALRRCAPRLPQRGCLPGRRVVGAHRGRLGVGAGRQPLGPDPRRAVVHAATDRAGGPVARRDHVVDGRDDSRSRTPAPTSCRSSPRPRSRSASRTTCEHRASSTSACRASCPAPSTPASAGPTATGPTRRRRRPRRPTTSSSPRRSRR